MTYIELSDGTTNRRIEVPDLREPVRIDTAGDAPVVEVSDRATVERRSPAVDSRSRSGFTFGREP